MESPDGSGAQPHQPTLFLHLDQLTVRDVTRDARRDGCKDIIIQIFSWDLAPKVGTKAKVGPSQCLLIVFVM